jgi:amino acid adenylation domain-containing protein
MKFNTIQDLLADCFQRSNLDRIAIEQGDRQISYAQLGNAANTLVALLSAQNVSKGTHIAVIMEDRLLTMVAVIAICNAGCVFMPIDPKNNIAKINNILDLVMPALIMTDAASFHSLQDKGLSKNSPVLTVDDTLFKSQDNPANFQYQSIPALPDDPLYIYFTSGTTAAPKAIIGRNIGLVHFICWEAETFSLHEHTKISQLTPPWHDPYLRDLFTTLLIHGTICIPPDNSLQLSPFELKKWLNDTAVTLVHCTPTLFRNLCNARLNASDFIHLKRVLLAGEQLHGKDIANWRTIFGERIELINLYGPTETTLAKLFHPITAVDAEKAMIPIGRPINDTTIYIVNAETAHLCDPGEIGELYISTRYTSLGYYNDAALNDIAFVYTQFGDSPNLLYYKTGDYVKRLPDDNIVFVERKDKMVKLRGKQVQLGEIENSILYFQGITACLVLPLYAETVDQEILVAYYMSGQNISSESLTEHLMETLPSYMLPAHFIRMETFPMNGNGKVDIAAFPLPQYQFVEDISVQENTDTMLLEKLTLVWREILNKENISTQDIFMQSGGDSLGIMLLIAKISEEFDMELTLWQIFDDLTIEKLAGYIKEVTA